MATEVFQAILEFDATPMEKGAASSDRAIESVERRLKLAEGATKRFDKAQGTLGKTLGQIEGPVAAARSSLESFVSESFDKSLPVFTKWESAIGRIRTAISQFEAAPTGTTASVAAINDLVAAWDDLGTSVQDAGMQAQSGLDAYSEGVLIAQEIQSSFPPVIERTVTSLRDVGEVLPQVTRGFSAAAIGYKTLSENSKALAEIQSELGVVFPEVAEKMSTLGGIVKTAILGPIATGNRLWKEYRKLTNDAAVTTDDMSESLRELVESGDDAVSTTTDLTSSIAGQQKALRDEIFVLKQVQKRLELFGQSTDETDQQVADLAKGIESKFGAMGFAVEEALNRAGLSIDSFQDKLDRVFEAGIRDFIDAERELERQSERNALAAERRLEKERKLNEEILLESNRLLLLQSELAATTTFYEDLAAAVDDLGDSLGDLPAFDSSGLSLGKELASVVDASVEGMAEEFERLQEGWLATNRRIIQEWIEGLSAVAKILVLAALDAGDAIVSAIIEGDVSQLADQFADIGREMGAQFGLIVGFALAGPVGALIGNVLGQVIGDAIGKTIGGAVASLLVSLGLAPDPKRILGSFAIGPGGFSGIGGTPEAQAQGQAMLDQIEDIFDALNRALGGTVELSQNMLIEVKRNGEAVLKIIDTATGNILSTETFASLQAAVDAGLAQLFSTAIVNAEGPMSAAFQEILSNALELGAEGVLEAFEKLSALGTTIEGLGGPADQATAAIENQIATYSRARSEIESLNLSVGVTADLIADLDRRFQNFQEAAELNVLGQLADMAERFGIAAEFVREIRIAEVRLQFAILEATLIAHGIWEENIELFTQLKELALLAASAIADVAEEADRVFGPSGPQEVKLTVPTRGLPVDVVNADEIGADREALIRRRREAARPFFETIALGGRTLSPVEAAYRRALSELADLQREFGNILGDINKQLFIEARILEVINPRIESAFDSLEKFRASLDLSAFAPGSRADKANAAMADFLELLSAAEGGDLEALEGLGGAAQTALELASQAFGTSTDIFEGIFNQITAGLDRVLGDSSGIADSIREQQLEAILGQSALMQQSLSAQNEMVSLLQGIRTALQSQPLQQASSF